MNDIAITAEWELQSWRWPKPVHINILEASAYYRLLRSIALETSGLRFASLIDSNVARCAIAKGRSSSRALASVLDRIGAICIAFDLHGALPLCPTRLDGPF